VLNLTRLAPAAARRSDHASDHHVARCRATGNLRQPGALRDAERTRCSGADLEPMPQGEHSNASPLGTRAAMEVKDVERLPPQPL